MTRVTGLGSKELDWPPTSFTTSGGKEMRGSEGRGDDGEETGKRQRDQEMATQREHRRMVSRETREERESAK